MEKAKKNYVFSVISLGEKLLEAKQSVGFGQWEAFSNTNSKFAFDMRQSQKYMQIARHKELVIALFKSGNMRPSVNQITKAIASAKPLAEIIERPNNEETVIDSLMTDSLSTLGKVGQCQDEIIEGEFIEIKPEQDALPTPHDGAEDYTDADYEKDAIADLVEENQRLIAEIEQLKVICEDDDNIAAAVREIGKLKAIIAGLEDRINGLLNENAAAIRQVNFWEKQSKKFKKEVESVRSLLPEVGVFL